MKIFGLNQVYQLQNNKIQSKEKTENIQKTYSNHQSLPKFSSSEMLGRSQLITFKGMPDLIRQLHMQKCFNKLKSEKTDTKNVNAIII